jgi:hypothetical protein
MRMHTLTILTDEEGLLKAIQPVDIQNQEPRTKNQEPRTKNQPMGVSFVWRGIEKREGSKNRR